MLNFCWSVPRLTGAHCLLSLPRSTGAQHCLLRVSLLSGAQHCLLRCTANSQCRQNSGWLGIKDRKQVVKAQGQETGSMDVVDEISSSSKSPRFSKQSASEVSRRGEEEPVHAVILVHGIVSTVRDWDYLSGELKKRLGKRFLIYASSSNEFLLTFQGVITAGERLANEVRTLVKKNHSLQRITFVAHSLGGLFVRYAIALLHEPHNSDKSSLGGSNQQPGTIAGLEPVCFITLATPHLGVSGKGQLPFLLGLNALEKLAPSVAPFITGETGRQLFLGDGSMKDKKLPILVEMAADSPGKPFLSALKTFRLRLLYANAGYDRMVGWQTSSIRRAAELPVIPKAAISPLYRHIVLVQNSPAVEGTNLPDPHSFTTDPSNDVELYHEYMIAGLQQVSWRKVDVNFEEAFLPFFAHNYIHVKMEWLHFEGAGVIRHVADTILEQHSDAFLSKL